MGLHCISIAGLKGLKFKGWKVSIFYNSQVMWEMVINGSDLDALLPFSEALRVPIIFKNGTFALATLLDVALLLPGGQCYRRAWSCSCLCPRAIITITAVILKDVKVLQHTKGCWSLAAYVQSEGTLPGL